MENRHLLGLYAFHTHEIPHSAKLKAKRYTICGMYATAIEVVLGGGKRDMKTVTSILVI